MSQHKESYDAIIIGFGKGGKTLAATLGSKGKRTLLIEKSAEMYGGTCINVGCIPTKFLVHRAEEAARSESFDAKKALYAAAISSKNALTTKLRDKNFHKVADTPNVTVLNGTASFHSPHEVSVRTENGEELFHGEQIFINTGSRPILPAIPGLTESARVYTSENLLALETLPEKLVIIGGGYIGVEFASIYASFGSKVTIIQDGDKFLPREDAEIAEAVLQYLKSRGVALLRSTGVQSVTDKGDNVVLSLKTEAGEQSLSSDAVLVATGRRPNTEGLQLEKAGVELTARGGLVVNEHLQTTAPHIYAMGDVIGGLQFTYISLDDFRVVRSSVLGDGSYTTAKRGAVPYSVFLSPPFSRVGMSEKEALEKGYSVKVARLAAMAIPKAQVLEQPNGLLKAVIDEKTGKILGAHLFCEESHELINTVKLAMDAGLPYTVLRDMIFTHPTMGEAFNDLFNI